MTTTVMRPAAIIRTVECAPRIVRLSPSPLPSRLLLRQARHCPCILSSSSSSSPFPSSSPSSSSYDAISSSLIVASARPNSASAEEDRDTEDEDRLDDTQQRLPDQPAPPFLARIGPFIRSRQTLSLIRASVVEAVAAIGASRLKNSSAQVPPDPIESAARETIGVAEDGVDQFIVPENGEGTIAAPPNPSAKLGFSFSAAGLLFPYHLGVAQCLIESGLITDKTPLAGSSAGAIVCAVIASGVSMQEAMLATKELAADCRSNGTAFRLGVVLRGSLEKCLPDNAHIECNGRIQVAITQVFRSPRALLVDQFDSKSDLIDALHTSSFIPGYFAARPVTLYKNRICMDGGLTLFMPPTSAETTVRICAFPAAQLGLKGIGISPDCNPTPGRASPRQLLNWALEPASDDVLDKLFDLGYRDASVWAEEHNTTQVHSMV